MKRRIFLISASLIFIFSALISAQNSDIEGTYQLVTRKLPDGTRMKDPDIKGLATFTKTHRNFNIVWKDQNGKHYSYAVASEYKLTDSDYTEKIIFSVLNDEIGGNRSTYIMSEKSETVPVKDGEGKVEIKMPFDPVTIVFNGERFTATSDTYTDYWVKIKE